MFIKIKHGFDRKGKRAVALLATITLLCSFTGCSNGETPSPTDRNITSVGVSNSVNETGFDIDRVRKSIVIKGQTIEIPVKLGEIPEGWSYKLYDEKDVYLRDNQFLATMYYLSLIHISEPTRQAEISYAVFCLKKKIYM